MKPILIVILLLIVAGCKKDDPVIAAQTPIPEFPYVAITQSNYTETDIQSRVPDTTWKNKCCLLFKNNLTESRRKQVVNDLLQKAQIFGQEISAVSGCLKATGQTQDSIVSVPYFAERAKYQSKECWIFEFAWGVHASDLGHHRCFVMDISTKDTLLYITCR